MDNPYFATSEPFVIAAADPEGSTSVPTSTGFGLVAPPLTTSTAACAVQIHGDIMGTNWGT